MHKLDSHSKKGKLWVEMCKCENSILAVTFVELNEFGGGFKNAPEQFAIYNIKVFFLSIIIALDLCQERKKGEEKNGSMLALKTPIQKLSRICERIYKRDESK